MKIVHVAIMCAYVVVVFLSGCVAAGSRVVSAQRAIPEYSNSARIAINGARVSVYPALDSGDGEQRMMRGIGYSELVAALMRAGCEIVPAERSVAGSDRICIVELADCRHDMPERGAGGVSLVTVVAVRVRSPGRMRDGKFNCGRARSFQGVCRKQLGQRPIDFEITEEDHLAGIAEAVANLVQSTPFREAIADVIVKGSQSAVPSGADRENNKKGKDK